MKLFIKGRGQEQIFGQKIQSVDMEDRILVHHPVNQHAAVTPPVIYHNIVFK